MANKKKKNDSGFQMQDTKEMDLQQDKQTEQGNNSQPPISAESKPIDILSEKYPNEERSKLEALLKDMPLNDAVYVLEEEKNLPSEKTKEVETSSQVEPESNTNNKPEVKPMTEETKPEEMSVEEKFNALMAEQNKMQKALEKKKGGVTSVDDTVERIDRSTQIAADGRRRGRKFKPSKGVAMFMATQNAKYKASGKPAPYSDQCIKNTLMREEGVLEGKA